MNKNKVKKSCACTSKVSHFYDEWEAREFFFNDEMTAIKRNLRFSLLKSVEETINRGKKELEEMSNDIIDIIGRSLKPEDWSKFLRSEFVESVKKENDAFKTEMTIKFYNELTKINKNAAEIERSIRTEFNEWEAELEDLENDILSREQKTTDQITQEVYDFFRKNGWFKEEVLR